MLNRKLNGVIPEYHKCNKCNEIKQSDFFSKTSYKGKYFLKNECKMCVCKRVKEYKEKNREKVLEAKRRYWHSNRDRLLEKGNENSRRYAKENPEKRRASARNWAKRNKEKFKSYVRERYNTNPEFNITIKIRRRIYMALFRSRGIKENKTVELLGCTPAFFKSYIESLFTEGMTWEKILNSEIHLDHIIPCSKFNLLDKEEQKKCFHYTNMQPLWEKDNLYKHNKII